MCSTDWQSSLRYMYAWMCLFTAKKEEVEAIEKEAKDKHEKEWEGKKCWMWHSWYYQDHDYFGED